MDLGGIDIKIMAFIGTDDCSDLITRLAKYTDKIYAAVSSAYGKSVFPGGNITLISSYLDENAIQRWIDRAGIGMIIDGVAETASEERELIRQKAEENGIEYLRVADHLKLSKNIRICKTRDELLSSFTYSTGMILVEGSELYSFLHESGIETDRLTAMVRPDYEEISKLKEAGCPEERILSFGMILHEAFLLSLFDELQIRHYVMKGGVNRGIAEKISALNHSDAHAYIDGVLADQEGNSSAELWKKLRKRFNLKD